MCFTIYLDDSGTSPDQRVAIASAVVIPAAQIIRLENEWESLKKKEHFSSFHTSEFVAKNPKSDFASWDTDKQKRVFGRVRQISRKYGIKALSFAVNKKDYEEVIFPEDFRNYVGKYHYTWAVRHLISFIDQWRLPRKIGPLEYVFDWMGKTTDPKRVEVETVMEQAEWIANKFQRINEYTNYGFYHRPDVAGLQCVDAIGWTCYQQAMARFCNTPLHEFADSAWADYGGPLNERGWLEAVTVTRDNLGKWLAAELVNEQSKAYFKEWNERQTAKGKRLLGEKNV
jgi:hypothetical protein